MPHPESVYIGDEVDLERISGEGVIIHPGCTISGRKTLIMEGARLGQEGSATIEDCLVGPRVELKGGYFRGSVFLEGSSMASGAHVREACILEEEARCAHTVGLKHTILFPFVTLGSLINFCDCLMAGGTGPEDHSEVGSSYIHFNFTPNQDKATASLIGDVPRGVMLDERPIFLGGQGGLVGPAVIGYGTVIAAGVIFRGDFPDGGKIIKGLEADQARKKFVPGLLPDIKNRVRNNILYIANIIALKAWYINVRSLFAGSHVMGNALNEGAVEKLDDAISERIARLKGLTGKIPASLALRKGPTGEWAPPAMINQQQELHKNWHEVEETIQSHRSFSGHDQERDTFLAGLVKAMGSTASTYVAVIKGLQEPTRKEGTVWLEGIVREVTRSTLARIPLFR